MNEQILERVFNQPRPPLITRPLEYDHLPIRRNGWTWINKRVEWAPVENYATDIAAAMKAEDRIAELGLQGRYVINLAKIVDPRIKQDDAIMTLWWNLVHASPDQRCRAALQCVKEKAKAAGG